MDCPQFRIRQRQTTAQAGDRHILARGRIAAIGERAA
jgi:hypothetical protein